MRRPNAGSSVPALGLDLTFLKELASVIGALAALLGSLLQGGESLNKARDEFRHTGIPSPDALRETRAGGGGRVGLHHPPKTVRAGWMWVRNIVVCPRDLVAARKALNALDPGAD